MAEVTFQSLRQRGLCLVPLRPPVAGDKETGKAPALKDWKELARNADDRTFHTWLKKYQNFGIFLGPSRLVVVDTDSAEAESWAREHLPETPWMTQTAKGFHRFYRLPVEVQPPRGTVGIRPGVDLRGLDNQVVAPGSVHYTGAIYEARGNWEIPLESLPCFDPAWFQTPAGPIHASPPAPAPAPAATAAGCNRPPAAERAVRYLLTIPPAIQGQGGSAQAFQAALHIARGFDLAEAEALALLMEHYNPRCVPPWTEDELRHKVKDALASPTMPLGLHLEEGTVAQDWPCIRLAFEGGEDMTSIAKRFFVKKSEVWERVRSEGWRTGRRPRTEPPAPTPEPSGQVIEPPLPADSPTAGTEGQVGEDDPTRPAWGYFQWSPKGLSYVVPPPPDKPGKTAEVTRLSGDFQVIAETRDERSSGWGLLLRWQDRDGAKHEWNMPRAATKGEAPEVLETLMGGGLWVNLEAKPLGHFLRYLRNVQTLHRARAVQTIGWHGRELYVLPDEAFGQEREGERVFLASMEAHTFTAQGTLEDWQEHLGRFCTGNSRLAFFVSCAFAAPFLTPLGWESGGFHLFGGSSTGKSTCAKVAGSVWGGPVFHKQWRTTGNALEGTALAHNDALLILDEIAQVEPREAGEIAYMLANEQDKARSHRGERNRASRRWKLLFLSTGEETLKALLAHAGKNIKAGQEVRLVDIPANPENQSQAFENWAPFESSKALVDHLNHWAPKDFGVPIRAFLSRLSGRWEEAFQEIQAKARAWAKENHPRGADSMVSRAVDRFALVAAAGEMAIELGVLPCPPRTALWAAYVCLWDWIEQRGGIGNSEMTRGIDAVLAFLDRHGSSRFEEAWEKGTRPVTNRAGFRKCDKAANPEFNVWDYYLTPAGWAEACEGFNPADVAQAMRREGLLEAEEERCKKTIRVPGVGLQKLYALTGKAISRYRNGGEDMQTTAYHAPELDL